MQNTAKNNSAVSNIDQLITSNSTFNSSHTKRFQWGWTTSYCQINILDAICTNSGGSYSVNISR